MFAFLDSKYSRYVEPMKRSHFDLRSHLKYWSMVER